MAKRCHPWYWDLLTLLEEECFPITVSRDNLHKQNTEFAITEPKLGQNEKCSFPSQEHVARGKVSYFANGDALLMRGFGPGKKGGKKKNYCFNKIASMERGGKSLSPELKAKCENSPFHFRACSHRRWCLPGGISIG